MQTSRKNQRWSVAVGSFMPAGQSRQWYLGAAARMPAVVSELLMRLWLIIGILLWGCGPPAVEDASSSGPGLSVDTGSEPLDCDAPSDWFYDADGDGYGDDALRVQACAQPVGHVTTPGDCDDIDPAVFPDAGETCNGRDDNCDGVVDEDLEQVFYADADADGFGDADAAVAACQAPSGHVMDNTDCNDEDAAANPDAPETCNEVDDDCDGEVDEDLLLPFHTDADGDSYGHPELITYACTAPEGAVTDGTDCDDADDGINPGAIEVCNEVDDDCDDQVDEGLLTTFYSDADGDGYGDAALFEEACTAPDGTVMNDADCLDSDPSVHPDATETCNGIDDNCDDSIDEGVTLTYFTDWDGDGYGDPSTAGMGCTVCSGCVTNDEDCLDTDISVHPGATETCNEIDDDCDSLVDEDVTTTFYTDADSDGYGDTDSSVEACEATLETVAIDGDCDDTDAAVHPGATEVCNDQDEDCNGYIDEDLPSLTLFWDGDGDGYGDSTVSEDRCLMEGWVASDEDCDDADVDVYPGAPERLDGTDNDCSDRVDDLLSTDADGVISGDPEFAGLGIAMAGGKDLDGDEIPDLLVGGTAAASAYVFSGDLTGILDVGSASATLSEDEMSECWPCLGSSLAVLSDFDGDGAPDVALGAPHASVSSSVDGEVEGVVYLFYGPISGAMDLIDADLEIHGPAPDGMFALSLASAGLHTDGGEGLLVSTTASERGVASVHMFQVVSEPTMTLEHETARFTASETDDGFGTGIAGIADINGDGYDEVLIGAPYGVEGTHGAIYLFYGPTTEAVSAIDSDIVLYGDTADGSFGYAVAGGGDVDGDGTKDMVIGAPGISDEGGRVYVVLGTLDSTDVAVSTVAEAVLSDGVDGLGGTVAMNGDVNGDDLDDVLAGAPGTHETLAKGGHVALFLGGMSGIVDTADVIVRPDVASQSLGASVTFMGDVDSNGQDDLAVGAPGIPVYGGTSSDLGAVHLFLADF
jgi:hypothetical protein